MRIAVVGGGPGGLFFATLIRQADPSIEVTVFERNRADDAFGFGVVFSDQTLAGIHAADPVLREALADHGRHWQDIEVRIKGERIRCGGNGMAAIARRTLLALLQTRAREAGARLRFSTEVDLDDVADHDLVVAADGTGSLIRTRLEEQLVSSVQTAAAKFIWFGTDYMFDGLTFVHERGPHGVFAVHGYPISADTSTFIVECDETSWRAAGLDSFDVTQPPGPSDMTSRAYLEELFAEQIDGHRLLVNNSRWSNFRTRRTRRWYTTDPRPVALLGDAVHTAHFSVGSGTKMAMEDAIALSAALVEHGHDLPSALSAYEAAARPSVEAIQDSARPSLAWWERFGQYYDAFEPWQFAFHFLSRSITCARLARRAPDFVSASHERWHSVHGAEPLESPLDLAGWSLPGRAVVVEREGENAAVAHATVVAPSAAAHLTAVAHATVVAPSAAALPTAVTHHAGVGPSSAVARPTARATAVADPGAVALAMAHPSTVTQATAVTLPNDVADPSTVALTAAGAGVRLPLRPAPRGPDPFWGAWVAAPGDERDLADACDRLAELAGAGPALVAVHGGTVHTRTLLAEHARLHHGLPSLLVDDDLDRDRAVTVLLSGRADLVGARAEIVASWAVTS